MFKKSVASARQGDRVAMCVPQLDSNLMERGLVVDPKFPIPKMTGIIATIQKLNYFKFDIKSKSKFHLTLGHETIMARANFFCPQVGGHFFCPQVGGHKRSPWRGRTSSVRRWDFSAIVGGRLIFVHRSSN